MHDGLPWRKHHVSGWASIVGQLRLRPLEEWAAQRLLDYQTTHGRIPALPEDVGALLKLLGRLKPHELRTIRVEYLLTSLFAVVVGDAESRANPGAGRGAPARRPEIRERRRAWSEGQRGEAAQAGR